jgi:hypothetical protein
MFSTTGLRLILFPGCGWASGLAMFLVVCLGAPDNVPPKFLYLLGELTISVAVAISVCLPTWPVRMVSSIVLAPLLMFASFTGMEESYKFYLLRGWDGFTHAAFAYALPVSLSIVILDQCARLKGSRLRWIVGLALCGFCFPSIAELLFQDAPRFFPAGEIPEGILCSWFRNSIYLLPILYIPKVAGSVVPHPEIRLEPKPIIILVSGMAGYVGAASGTELAYYADDEAWIAMGACVGLAIGAGIALCKSLPIRLAAGGVLGFTAVMVGVGLVQLLLHRTFPTLRDSQILVPSLIFGIPTSVLTIAAHLSMLRHRWTWQTLLLSVFVYAAIGAWSQLGFTIFSVESSRPGALYQGGITFWLKHNAWSGIVFGWVQLAGLVVARLVHWRIGKRLIPGDRRVGA